MNFSVGSQPDIRMLNQFLISNEDLITNAPSGETFTSYEFSEFLEKQYPDGIKIAEFSSETTILFGLRAYHTSYLNPTGLGGIYDEPSKVIKTKLKKVNSQWKIYSLEIEDYEDS